MSSSSTSSPSCPGPFDSQQFHRVFPTALPRRQCNILYATVLQQPSLILEMEQQSLYEEDESIQSLVCVFHHLVSTQMYLATLESNARSTGRAPECVNRGKSRVMTLRQAPLRLQLKTIRLLALHCALRQDTPGTLKTYWLVFPAWVWSWGGTQTPELPHKVGIETLVKGKTWWA